MFVFRVLLSLLVFLLLFFSSTAHAREFKYNVLNQYNSSTNPQNRLISQYFTDPDLEAYMKGADDVLIPSDLGVQLGLNCTGLSITFVMVRVKHDQDPQSVTIEFFYDDESNSSSRPGILFYSKHFNDMVWDNISLNKVFNMTFDFKNGDINEITNGSPFNLLSVTSSNSSKRIWISFHATGPRDFSFAGFEENCLYWMTYGNIPTINGGRLYDNITLNQQYHFIDLNNSMREGLQQWTQAEIAEPLIGLNSHSYNLAWNVDLICHDSTPPVIDVVTPTLSPTMNPTTNTDEPTTTTSPTGSATPIFNENITDSPTLFNYTILETIDKKAVLIGIAVPIAIITLCCLCLCFCYRKWRRKKTEKAKQTAEFQMLNSEYKDETINLDGDNDTKGNIFSNGTVSDNNEIELQIFSNNNNNSKKKNKQH